MSVLKCLETIRSEFLDNIVLIVTNLGDEACFLIAALVIFWCVNKKWGYRLFSVFFTGIVINEALKLIVRMPRPFEIDPTLTPVKSALEGASGYSFPSGHTATATLTYGSIALFIKKRWAFVISFVLIAITAFTRLYLGVHTPADVIASFAVASIVVFFCFEFFTLADRKPTSDIWIVAWTLIVSVVAALFAAFSGAEKAGDTEMVKDAFKLMGTSLGLFVSYIIDEKYIHFQTKALIWQQIVKSAVGAAILLVLKSGLKYMFAVLMPESVIADSIRYFLLVVFAGCIYPLTFKFYKANKNKSERKHC